MGIATQESIQTFLEKNKESLYAFHKELCLIPAPSHHEERRAEFCKKWLEGLGAQGVYIDEALNVVFPYHCENSNRITVFNAHTDTVFPEETPLNFSDDGNIIRCPGVGDDTGSVAVLMFIIQYCLEQNYIPKNGILFVFNSCEEGLGNLKGTRQIYQDYAGRIAQMVAVDSDLDKIANACVGSHRYEVTVKTKGGHSFLSFGNKNAIAEAAEIIRSIYQIQVPHVGNSTTTYNVGTITGGTSVNTIAQKVSFLCEYRSDNVDCLAEMKGKFEAIFKEANREDVEVLVSLVGDRPCANGVDENEIQRLSELCGEEVRDVTGREPIFECSSTDCNIPLSIGIPAVAIGCFYSGGTHTTEEWLEKASLLPGFELVARIIVKLTK